MKTVTAIAALSLCFLPAAVMAEGKGNEDWAEKAARGYEEKAERAEKKGEPEAAAIYRRMAQIKRDAGHASKHGKDFSWEEYHKLEGELQHIKKQHHAKHGDHKKHDKHMADKRSPGDGFMKAAGEYREQAMMARKNGDAEKANIFMQLAKHKVAAAQAAKHGKGYDWSEYHELRKKLEGDHGKEDKHHAKHDKPADKQWHDEKKHASTPPKKLNIE